VPTRRALYLLPLAALLFTACSKQKVVQSTSGPPPVPVSVTDAAAESVPFEVQVVGTVEPSATVQVKSQVAGPLQSVHFTEGQDVSEGDLLFEIDPRPLQEDVRSAEAAIARDEAQLRQAEAALARDAAQAKNAEAEAARYTELDKAGVISKAQHDQIRTAADVSRETVRAAQAAIESIRAALDSDRAALQRAKLELSYTKIHAPISGRTGNLLVNAGNLVKANDIPLVVIHQVSPIFVSFSVPEEHLATIRQRSARQQLPVRVTPREDTEQTVGGYLSLVDNTVDPATGAIKLKATLDNRGGKLWPGQFVNVSLTLDTLHNATVVPTEAIQPGQNGPFVYVVRTDQSVEPRVVEPGPAVRGRTIIRGGIAAGDTVVTDGHQRLFPGAKIQKVESGKP
jgi:membrane fusion protein, multidrug efflux system